MLPFVCLWLVLGFLLGLPVGCLGTQWALGKTKCPRCGEMAAFLDIRYVCGTCGERVEEEQL